MELKEILNNISPVRVGDLPAFLQTITPLFDAFGDADEITEKNIMPVLASNADNFIEAVRLGSRVDRAWLNDQDASVLVELAARVLEVNADFFGQTMAVMGLTEPQPKGKRKKTGGRRSSPPLSEPDSDTKS